MDSFGSGSRYLYVSTSRRKIGLAAEGVAKTNTALQWGIILFIFIPISAGLAIFGYYSLKGEYDQLPTKSEDL